jgi:Domain of unknown function (DUF4926)
MKTPQLLDTIAILKPISIDRLSLMESEYDFNGALPVGLVGTIVIHEHNREIDYLVEFADSDGCEFAIAYLQVSEFITLQYELAAA